MPARRGGVGRSAFGQLLLGLRQKMNLSQDELADRVGVSRGTISQWEGQRPVPEAQLQALAQALGVSVEDLKQPQPEPRPDILAVSPEGGMMIVEIKGGIKLQLPVALAARMRIVLLDPQDEAATS